jgi:hypothetical protein
MADLEQIIGLSMGALICLVLGALGTNDRILNKVVAEREAAGHPGNRQSMRRSAQFSLAVGYMMLGVLVSPLIL